MKKTILIILLIFFLSGMIFAEENSNKFIVFNEGAASSHLTRIIYQSGRSNFVFRDFMFGLYLTAELQNFNFFTPMSRLAVYYPLVSAFNGFPQPAGNPLRFGIDFNLGAKFQILEFDFVRLSLSPAIHMLYLTSDRWNYFNLGAGLSAGFEIPLNEKFTILINGAASLDNGNLGGNSVMEPFDITYQYQIDIGVRYSKRILNKTGLFGVFSDEENINENSVINR